MSVLPFRPQSPAEVIENLADHVSSLTVRATAQGIRMADDDLHIEALERANTWLHKRLTKRRERELAAFLIGVGSMVALAGVVYVAYLVKSYRVAHALNDLVNAIGWFA